MEHRRKMQKLICKDKRKQQKQVNLATLSECSQNRKENPLQNSLVLQEIFKNLDSYDLKSCRLVCRQWYDESMPALRRCARILLFKDSDLVKFQKMTGLHGLCNYRLNGYIGSKAVLTKFMRLDNSLPLRDVTFHSIVITDEMLLFLAYYPNLECLTFSIFMMRNAILWQDTDSRDEKPLQDLRFPRLRRFECLHAPASELNILCRILLSAPNLSEIITRDAKINTFIFSRLNVWSRTLKNLEVGFVPRGSGWNSQSSFPILEKLRRITATGRHFEYPVMTKVPNLETAEFEWAILKDLFPPHLETTILTNLRIKNVNMKDWAGFTSEKFPFLKKLEFLEITNKLFRSVCQNIKTLEEFHIGKAINDYTVTGITRYKSVPLHDLAIASSTMKFKIKKHRKYPSICDLPNLTRLKISCKKLTAASIILGLVYCKSLVSLELEILDKSIISQVSQATLNAISDKLPNLRKLHIRAEKLRYEQVYTARIELEKKLPNCTILFQNQFSRLTPQDG